MSADYECENCIGMAEHGCYCMAMGAITPGGPAPSGVEVGDTGILASRIALLDAKIKARQWWLAGQIRKG